MPTQKQIDAAVKAVKARYDGFGDNCARFAAILNKVLGGDGTYVTVDGGHYEFADHVALLHRGKFFDGDGMSGRREFRERWCDDGETLEDFYDPTENGDDIRKLADGGAGFSRGYTDSDLEAAFRGAFADMGLVLDMPTDAVTPTGSAKWTI